VLGALGGARGPGEDRIVREQELARRRRTWRHGQRRGWPGACGGRQLGENYGGGWPESGTWDLQGAGGGTDRVATTASAVQGGSGRRQAAWHGRKRPARGRGR
jgi:hypothetical protein